jgi:hypothetical protein
MLWMKIEDCSAASEQKVAHAIDFGGHLIGLNDTLSREVDRL